MGETNGEPQGTPQDTGHTPEVPDGTTPAPQTYTEEQYKTAMQAALTKAGRDAAALEKRGKDLDTRETALTPREAEAERRDREREDQEMEAVKDDPVKLSVYQDRKRDRDARATLASDRKKLDADIAAQADRITASDDVLWEIAVFEIAEKYGADATALKDLGIKDKEQLEGLARKIGTKEPPPPPDSGVTTGSGKQDYSKVRFDKDAPTAQQMMRSGFDKQQK